MRRKIGTLFMILGAVSVLAALSLFLWNQRENRKAGIAVEKILPEVISAMEEEEELPDPYDTEMTAVEIDGYYYIGYLSIPVLELELPVMADWSYSQLKIAPCRYFGSTKTDNLVIAAHNYIRHFAKIKNLSVGDTVCFTDMDGVISMYEVVEMDILSPSAVEEMTAGDYDLTLFTCTYGGRSRVTVRCERTE